MELSAKKILFLVLLLALFAMACAQSGEILADGLATQRALPTPTTFVDLSEVAEYQIGDNVIIFGGTYGALVPLYGEPGSRFFSSQVSNQSLVTIENHVWDEEGIIWYLVDGMMGSGWILPANLEPILEIN